MKIHIINAENPVWANAEQTAIECLIRTVEYGDTLLPFLANPNDSEEHGRNLFNKLIAGDYGVIAPYISPTVASAQENKEIAETLLFETDWINQPDVNDSNKLPYLLNKEEFLTFREQVRIIAVSPVNGNLNWPETPKAIWQKQ